MIMKKTSLRNVSALLFAAAAFTMGPLNRAGDVALEGAKVGEWTMDFESAKKLAAEKKVPLLLNFTGSDWCGWCMLMDRQVFAKPAWKEYAAKNAMLVTLDFPRDSSIVPEKYAARNREMRDRFDVSGYPTYLVLDSDGSTVLGKLGAGKEKTAKSFIEEFKDVIRLSASSIEAKVQALGPEKGEAYKDAVGALKKAEQDLNDWFATRPVRNDENTAKYEKFLADIKAAKKKIQSF